MLHISPVDIVGILNQDSSAADLPLALIEETGKICWTYQVFWHNDWSLYEAIKKKNIRIKHRREPFCFLLEHPIIKLGQD